MKIKKGEKKTKLIKNKRPSFFRQIVAKFKRWQEIEQEKKELKKDINYSIKPKGYFARQIGVISFWVLFSFMFLVVVVTLFSGNDEATANEELKFEINQATTPEAIQFAENFLKDYFTWNLSENASETRKATMMKYVAKDLVGNSGLDIRNKEWNSSFKKSEVKRITEKGKNLAYITFLVEFDFTKFQTSKDGKQEVKQLKKYIDVPIAYDGYSFGVYELPKFTYIYEDQTTVSGVKTEPLEQADVGILEKIKSFLPTFFRTYAEDEKDKLNFMLLDEKVTDGLNGTMIFDSINSLQAFKGKEENKFIIFTEITLIEPETNTPFIVNHQLELTLEQNRLLVSGMNDYEDKGVISDKDEEHTSDISETNTEE